MSDTRIPTQKRSVEKRNRIIEKGFELMCNKGYHNTNTNEIADYAGVSTGIVYQYFKDKKEIFIAGIKNYSINIMYPELNILEEKEFNEENKRKIIEQMLDNFLKIHTISKKAHEELMAMEHLDDEVFKVFKENEMFMTDKIVEWIEKSQIKIPNIQEKIHVIMGIIDNFCHEIVYHKHEELDYNKMKQIVIDLIANTLK